MIVSGVRYCTFFNGGCLVSVVSVGWLGLHYY